MMMTNNETQSTVVVGVVDFHVCEKYKCVCVCVLLERSTLYRLTGYCVTHIVYYYVQ